MNHTISTERTRLRLIRRSDLEAIHRLHSIPEVDAFNTLGIPRDMEETKSIIETWIADTEMDSIQNFTFAIEHHSNREFVGLFGLKLGAQKFKSAEVWYKIHPDFWNRGIATEVLKKVIDYGFEVLKLHRIHAGCAVDNVGSIKVLDKVGMKREGRRREILPLKTGWSDNFEYAILETDTRPTDI